MSEARDTRGLVRSRKCCYAVVMGRGGGEDRACHWMERFLLSGHGSAEVCSGYDYDYRHLFSCSSRAGSSRTKGI